MKGYASAPAELIDFALAQAAPDSVPWAKELLYQADRVSLEAFVQWHDRDSLRAIFEWTPPWRPPRWADFVQYGIPDWPPLVQRITSFIPPSSFKKIRQLAKRIIGSASGKQEATFLVFWWVANHIEWTSAWGALDPWEIVERGYGNSYHIAQIYIALCRSIFIPCRMIEEFAFAPQSWCLGARARWDAAPSAVTKWLGDKILFHPVCEVKLEDQWVPVDAQRGQYGTSEFLQHIRIPELLKFSLTTWADYGASLNRTSDYALKPLTAGLRAADAERLQFLFAEVGQYANAAGDTGFASSEVVLKRLQELKKFAAETWSRTESRSHCRVIASQSLSASFRNCLQCASDTPISFMRPNDELTDDKADTVVVVGGTDYLNSDAGLDFMRRAVHTLVLYEPWGEGEKFLADYMSRISGEVKNLIFETGFRGGAGRTSGTGRFADNSLQAESLDLRLAVHLTPPPEADSALLAEYGSSGPMVVGFSQKLHRGRLTVLPISIASRADPYSLDPVAGCHRRFLKSLYELH